MYSVEAKALLALSQNRGTWREGVHTTAFAVGWVMLQEKKEKCKAEKAIGRFSSFTLMVDFPKV
jgi:hypothetical protein